MEGDALGNLVAEERGEPVTAETTELVDTTGTTDVDGNTTLRKVVLVGTPMVVEAPLRVDVGET